MPKSSTSTMRHRQKDSRPSATASGMESIVKVSTAPAGRPVFLARSSAMHRAASAPSAMHRA